jgi:diacylglycerol O-acyltransferase / wax synthase
MDRLNPLDVWFLHVEDDVDHMHIGSVGIFEGPPPRYEELTGHVQSKLGLLPRYRQRVQRVPLDLARPVWVDDPHFRLSYHLRHTALPRPGGALQLRRLVSRVMSQQLDRRRPLWEMWVAEGLEEDRWAVITKVHHCMVDGIAGTELMQVMLDIAPSDADSAVEPWEPEPAAGASRLLAGALRDTALAPVRAAARTAREPRLALRRTAGALLGVPTFAHLARLTPSTTLNGPVGPHRRWLWARGDLATVKAVRTSLGGTVNDVVLAAVTHGFRELLSRRGEPVAGRTVRTLVPVSLRSDGERGTYHNRVAAMFADLPVGIADPVERYQALRDHLEQLKRSNESLTAEALVALSGAAPAPLLELFMRGATRVVGRVGQRAVNTVTTNVPGPQQPLFLLGRQMVEAFPFVPIAEGVRIGVAIFSYDGALTFGLTGDYDTTADLQVLADGIEAGLAELAAAAGLAAAHAPPARAGIRPGSDGPAVGSV